MPRVLLSRRARDDLADIWTRVFLNTGTSTADRIIDRIGERMAVLARHPELGPRRRDIAADARALVVERWLVLYALAGDEVRVVRIVDGAVDLTRVGWEP